MTSTTLHCALLHNCVSTSMETWSNKTVRNKTHLRRSLSLSHTHTTHTHTHAQSIKWGIIAVHCAHWMNNQWPCGICLHPASRETLWRCCTVSSKCSRMEGYAFCLSMVLKTFQRRDYFDLSLSMVLKMVKRPMQCSWLSSVSEPMHFEWHLQWPLVRLWEVHGSYHSQVDDST